MSATRRTTRHPDIHYGADGKLIVAESDRTCTPLSLPSDAASGAGGDARIWHLADEEDTNGKETPAGVTTTSATSGGNRTGTSSPKYKRRVVESTSGPVVINANRTAEKIGTVNSSNASNASSSLLRRLHWRRSKHQVPRRTESDATEDGDRKHSKRRRRDGRSGGYSVDRPRRRRHSDAGEVTLQSTGNGSSNRQTSNAYWQEMIDESKRREQELASSSSKRRRDRKRKRKSSPSTSPVRSPARSPTRLPSTGSSLSRKHGDGSRPNGSLHSRGSSAAGGSKSRFGGGPPRMPADYMTTSLDRQRRMPDDAATTTISTTNEQRTNSSHVELTRRTVNRDGSVVWTERTHRRRTGCDRRCASGTTLVVVGCLLVIVGIVRLLVSYWHEIGSSVWSGVLVILFGFAHIMMSQTLTSCFKAAVYFILGAVASLAILSAAAISLVVIVPTLGQVTIATNLDDIDTAVLASVNFSKYETDRTVTGVKSATWPSVVLDLCSLVLLTVSLFTQTLTADAFDRYLNDVISDDVISDSNHRRHVFRSVDQLTVGQTTVFVGFFELIAAGIVSMLGDKMTSSKIVMILCAVLEFVSLLGCAATTVLTTLSLAKDAQLLQQVINVPATNIYASHVKAVITVEALSDCLSVVGIVFSVGIFFRHVFPHCNAASRRRHRHDISNAASPTSSKTGSTVTSGGRHRATMSNWRPSHETEMYVVGVGQT